MDADNLSGILCAAIQKDGRSLAAIAAEADIDRGILSRFMRGERGMNLDTTGRVLDALGLTCKLVRQRTRRA